MELRLRPVRADEVALLHRFHHDPEVAGHNWVGFRNDSHLAREHAEHGFLTEDLTRLAVEVDGEPAGLVTYQKGRYGIRGDYYEIGIALLPQFRGRGIGWRTQAMLAEYLFEHMPIQRVQAATAVENVAEQKALVKAGFRLEGVVRSAEFRAGQWRDGMLYSRLRDDPYPEGR
jgi:RimJ/RimL family protein N-acetyltransferase